MPFDRHGRGYQGQDHEVHRQDVEVVGHVGEGSELGEPLRRVGQERPEIEGPAEVLAAGRRAVDGGERGHDGHEDRDVGPVDLPDAQGDARGSREKSCLIESAAERQGTGPARAEDEDLRGVRKAEAGRDGFRPRVAGDVGIEDDEHAQSAEHVQAQVTRPFRRRSRGRHDARLRLARHHDVGAAGLRRQGRPVGSNGNHDGSHGGPDPALRPRGAGRFR